MRPTRDVTLMHMAWIAGRRSTCPRAHVGTIVAHAGRVLSSGYNGAPAGLDHCDHGLEEPCMRAVHAEVNAIAYAARYGVSTEGATLYSTTSPCLPCSQLIINAGIVRVVYNAAYRLDDGVELLREAGVAVARQAVRLDLFPETI